MSTHNTHASQILPSSPFLPPTLMVPSVMATCQPPSAVRVATAIIVSQTFGCRRLRSFPKEGLILPAVLDMKCTHTDQTAVQLHLQTVV